MPEAPTPDASATGPESAAGFARLQARTRGFTLGIPRGIVSGVDDDGPRVLFLRSDSGTDPALHLWSHDPVGARTVKLVDAHELGADATALPAAERVRRERAREQAGGIVAYSVDARLRIAAFTLGGVLHLVELGTRRVVAVETSAPAFDPRVAPTGDRVAFHAADGLHVLDLDGDGRPAGVRELVAEPQVTWGRAEFAAAEEMGRSRGFWWSPDGRSVAVARVDEGAVAEWTIADPATPWARPAHHRYPVAGTSNAAVGLWLVDVADGRRIEVEWDRGAYEYLTAVCWEDGGLLLSVQARDQREVRILDVDPTTGRTSVLRAVRSDPWVELVAGTPALAGPHLVTVEDRGRPATRRLCVDGHPRTPEGLHVRAVVGASEHDVWFVAAGEDPAEQHLHHLDPSDDESAVTRLTGAVPGVHHAVAGTAPGAPLVVVSQCLEAEGTDVRIHHVGEPGVAPVPGPRLPVVAAPAGVVPRPRLLHLGGRRLRAALLLPSGGDQPERLPVVLDPYGGPHAQRVRRARAAFLGSQWLADQGFAVLVVDGRGTPGRGPDWEREVHHDLATPVLEDQVAALQAAALVEPRLDHTRVGIRGWSFGGFLAALAVLRRPDVFRAAVAGAPVTDWRLYDTHYTERYLGHPDHEPAAYNVSSLVDAQGRLPGAVAWDAARPPELLLIHGLADDNVVAAHTLRLSAALLADGRPHRVLPLSGVTHMTPQEVLAERLLTLQVAFLRQALAG